MQTMIISKIVAINYSNICDFIYAKILFLEKTINCKLKTYTLNKNKNNENINWLDRLKLLIWTINWHPKSTHYFSIDWNNFSLCLLSILSNIP